MIDAALAEREKLARELAREYYQTHCLERDEPDLVDLLLKWGVVCANEALERAAEQPEKMAKGHWREGSGIYEELFNVAKRIRALKAEG